jgi:hypothetical protein
MPTQSRGHSTFGFDRHATRPKRELISSLQAAMQSKRLPVAKSLPLAKVLEKELLALKVKVSSAGNETFKAWREKDHDDLVLALAIGLWFGNRTAQKAWSR